MTGQSEQPMWRKKIERAWHALRRANNPWKYQGKSKTPGAHNRKVHENRWPVPGCGCSACMAKRRGTWRHHNE